MTTKKTKKVKARAVGGEKLKDKTKDSCTALLNELIEEVEKMSNATRNWEDEPYTIDRDEVLSLLRAHLPDTK